MMSKYSTGNATVDAVGRMSITGNVIPQSWYKTITKDTTGKPYLAAIVILADIVYWYRPTEVRDESTGETIAARKRFKSDMLQRSYAQIAEQFGITKRDATNAIVALEKLGVIKRHLRKMEVGGMTLSNVLFIELVPDGLESVTFPSETPITEIGDTYHSNEGEGQPKSVTPQTKTGDTYTETTQKTTQETTQRKKRETRAELPKHKHGEFGHVLLTDKELDKLRADFPDKHESMIRGLDEYLEMHPSKRYNNHNLTMRRWEREDREKALQTVPASKKNIVTRTPEQVAAQPKWGLFDD